MSDLSPALVDGLRDWARGSLPAMAAVEFLLACPDVLYDRHPMLTPYGERGQWALDLERWHEVDMSGGTVAAWQLARSILSGEIEDTFWRLDPVRKAAFIDALSKHQR